MHVFLQNMHKYLPGGGHPVCSARIQTKRAGGSKSSRPPFGVNGEKYSVLAVFLVLPGCFAAGSAAGAVAAALAAEAAVFADEHKSRHKADHNDRKHQKSGQIHE